MKNRKIIYLILFFVTINNISFGQKFTRPEYKEYVETYLESAINEMLLFKIPASITLAQGIIESNSGRSLLATEANNHFGIKCHKEWLGDTYTYDDDKKGECFRKYKNATESYRDHSLFLTSRPRYSNLFVIPLKDYKGWAHGLKAAGYATNPVYAESLIRVIEENQLMIFDDTVNVFTFEKLVKNEYDSTLKQNEIVVPHVIDSSTIIIPAAVKHQKEFKDYVGKILFFENYVQPNPENYEISYVSKNGRNVYKNFGVYFIFARAEDTWKSIADEFNISSTQIYKQNDLVRNDKIVEGQILYLGPKRKSSVTLNYEVKEGESMYSISQEQCVKLNKLYKYNRISKGMEPRTGANVYLRD